MTFDQLSTADSFSRQAYFDAYQVKYGTKSKYALDYALRKATSSGSVTHIGRNQYVFNESKQVYIHNYSPEACQIAEKIQKEYPLADFRVFELTQLNAFVNHLFAQNTIFVSVEKEVIDYVFDYLRNECPGRIMLKPRTDEYYRYWVDKQIVIIRLPSESPKGIREKWHSRIEKILVDITVDKLIAQLVSDSEYDVIFNEALSRYLVDTNAMLRYARRKGAGNKFREYLTKYSHLTVEE